MVHLFVALLVDAFILVTGFLAGVTVPRLVRWDRRTLTMLSIWGAAILLAVLAFVVIV